MKISLQSDTSRLMSMCFCLGDRLGWSFVMRFVFSIVFFETKKRAPYTRDMGIRGEIITLTLGLILKKRT